MQAGNNMSLEHIAEPRHDIFYRVARYGRVVYDKRDALFIKRCMKIIGVKRKRDAAFFGALFYR